MSLLELLRHQLGEPRREPANGRPDPAACLVVTEVAAVSPAGIAGVAKGDLIVSIDQRAAVETEADDHPLETGRHAWRIHSPKRGSEVVIETHLPLGVRLRPTAAAVEATHGPTSPHDRLVGLWEDGEWEVLHRVASAAFERALKKGGDALHTPSRVLLGAALYELGRREEGLAHVREYKNEHETWWTTNFYAVGRYVLAMECLRCGRRQNGVSLLQQAFQYLDVSDRIASAIEKEIGKRPSPDRPDEGKPLPVDYRLPVIVGEEPEARFSRALERMKPGQLMTVCTLGSYRANGPYHEFMDRYHWFTETLGPRIHELHVITSESKKEGHADSWFEGEDRARAAGVRFLVLYDEEEDVLTELYTAKSPWNFVVDRRGTVLHEGRMDEVDVWNALAAADEEGAPALPTKVRRASPVDGTDGTDLNVASCLAVTIILAVTAGGGTAGWFLWGGLGLVGGSVLAGLIALLVYGATLPPDSGKAADASD